MQPAVLPSADPAALARMGRISQARQWLLDERAPTHAGLVDAWIERSWSRCLASGQAPQQRVVFEAVSQSAMRHAEESNRQLARAARPVLQQLGSTLSATGYFAILTNAEGVVADVHGPIDRSDRRVDLITRIGVDLSEPKVGTTAIGAALAERQAVWLHRGEHFFDDTSCYSCAGAPLFGPLGQCVGMLDLTGVDAPERPELKHLVALSVRRIENVLARMQPHALLLRLNWPGHRLGDDDDGLLGLDGDGYVASSNSAARQMLPQLANALALALPRTHCSELFALPYENLFDAAGQAAAPRTVPLWSGLQLQVLAQSAAAAADAPRLPQIDATGTDAAPRRLRDIETALIRKAVDEARGNVALAAQRLGVSRATVYRKLGLRRG